MKKRIFLIFIIFLGIWFFSQQAFAKPENNSILEIQFFYSETCPHCITEQKFLDGLAEKYPKVKINRYLITDQALQQLLKDLLKKHDAEEYFGLVPLTFVGEDFIPGFDNSQGIGKKIEESIQLQP